MNNLIREFEDEDKFSNEDFVLKGFNLSENQIKVIRQNPNNYDWHYLCYHRNLSEDFIIEFQNYILWDIICFKQKLSKEFVIKYSNKIHFDRLLNNEKISGEIKELCRIFL